MVLMVNYWISGEKNYNLHKTESPEVEKTLPENMLVLPKVPPWDVFRTLLNIHDGEKNPTLYIICLVKS